MGKVLISRS